MQPTKPPVRCSVPPYDTGKVKIGLAYTRLQPWSPSRDAFALQTALLSATAIRPTLLERLASFFRSFV
jgi:hypothetical protein